VRPASTTTSGRRLRRPLLAVPVVDLDPAFGQQLLDVTVGQGITQSARHFSLYHYLLRICSAEFYETRTDQRANQAHSRAHR
jgi:hypothetical protein